MEIDENTLFLRDFLFCKPDPDDLLVSFGVTIGLEGIHSFFRFFCCIIFRHVIRRFYMDIYVHTQW